MSLPERWARHRELPVDISQRLPRLLPLFAESGVQLAYLFGSLAKQGCGQDVDLALLSLSPVFRLRSEISECLGTERIDLQRATPILRFEIVQTGQWLYAATSMVREQFELATLRLYRDTAFLRACHRQYLYERIAP